ncbi:MAG: pyridoxamine 5'-phosphate oxidase family protein [Actinomycetota bacterium]
MPSTVVSSIEELPGRAARLLSSTRRAVLGTTDPEGSPHLVPSVFIVLEGDLLVPIDAKPKASANLKRLRNIARDPRATMLIDRWDEEWSKLEWLMIRCIASLESVNLETAATAELLRRYPQYANLTPIESLIRLRPTKLTWWSWTG